MTILGTRLFSALILLCAWTQGVQAQTGSGLLPVNSEVVFYDGFEEGISGWMSTGPVRWHTGPWKLGAGSVQLRRAASFSRRFDTTGWRDLTVQISLAAVGLEPGEGVRVELLRPDGSWYELTALSYGDDDGLFRYFTLELPSTAWEGVAELRVALQANQLLDAAYLDEFYLQGRAPDALEADPGLDCPACIADFALYDPYYEDDGVWEEEVVALRTLFAAFGWTSQLVDHVDLDAGWLGSGDSRRFRALIAPGGYAAARNRDVSAAGERAIREFLSTGGSFVGFCAGTFWVAETVTWAESATGDGGTYNQAADYRTYPYDLGLFSGDAQGPFGWTPWENGTGASLQPVRINSDLPLLAGLGLPTTTRFFYYGGPYYEPLGEPPPGWEVWAWAEKPAEAPEAATLGAGAPAVVRFSYGQGSVMLFSHHPEILIGSDADGVTLRRTLDEADMEWYTDEQTMSEIHLDSWNLVHVALQLAANEDPTALTSLP